MRIFTNKGKHATSILDALSEKKGMPKTASVEAPDKNLRKVAEDVHLNKICSNFIRSGYTTSTLSKDDTVKKQAEKELSDKVLGYMAGQLKSMGIRSCSIDVGEVANVQVKTAGLNKNYSNVLYADVNVELSHPSLMGKSASVIVSVAEKDIVPPSFMAFGNKKYAFSKDGWDELINSNIPTQKTASEDSRSIIIRKYNNENDTPVPNGYYAVLGTTENYVKLCQDLKAAGVMYNYRTSVPEIGNCIEPALIKEGDLEKVASIVDKYCQMAPPSFGGMTSKPVDTPVKPGETQNTTVMPQSKAKQFMQTLQNSGQSFSAENKNGKVAITTEQPISAVQGTQKMAQVATPTRGTVDEGLVNTAFDIFNRVKDSATAAYPDVFDEAFAPVENYLISLINNNDANALSALSTAPDSRLVEFAEAVWDSLDDPDVQEQTLGNPASGQTDVTAIEETNPTSNPNEAEVADGQIPDVSGQMESSGSEGIAETMPQGGEQLTPALAGATGDMGLGSFEAARKDGVPWSEGTNDTPTKNAGPASGGVTEMKGPGGTQKLIRSGESKKAPEEKGRETSPAWNAGSGGGNGVAVSEGSNKAPTKNAGPASAGVTEMKGPGGTQKLWDQQNQTPGSTTMPKDGGTADEFFSRETTNPSGSAVDEWFDREGGGKGKGKGAPGGMSSIMKGASIIKNSVDVSKFTPEYQEFRKFMIKKLSEK